MDIFQFKTNITSASSVQEVSKHLDKINNVHNWEIETNHAHNRLTIRGKGLEPKAIETALKRTRFNAELLGRLAPSKKK